MLPNASVMVLVAPDIPPTFPIWSTKVLALPSNAGSIEGSDMLYA